MISDIAQASIITSGLGVIVFLVLLLVMFELIKPSKSRIYRRFLVDMYVAGMIRKFCKEDSIDIDTEIKEFNRMEKRMKLDEKSLDGVVETELNERIVKASEDKLEDKKE